MKLICEEDDGKDEDRIVYGMMRSRRVCKETFLYSFQNMRMI